MGGMVDVRRALLALLNISEGLSDDDDEMAKRVDGFVATYGPLRKIISANRTLADIGAPLGLVKEEAIKTQDVFDYSELFGLAVSTKARLHRNLNLMLGEIFQSPVVIDGVTHPTALEVDIVAGTVEPRPRDLLDALALEFMHSRKVIARCASCSKFFYRQFSKDKYCSPICATEARRKQQTAWVAEKRAMKEQAKKKTTVKKGREQ